MGYIGASAMYSTYTKLGVWYQPIVWSQCWDIQIKRVNEKGKIPQNEDENKMVHFVEMESICVCVDVDVC